MLLAEVVVAVLPAPSEDVASFNRFLLFFPLLFFFLCRKSGLLAGGGSTFSSSFFSIFFVFFLCCKTSITYSVCKWVHALFSSSGAPEKATKALRKGAKKWSVGTEFEFHFGCFDFLPSTRLVNASQKEVSFWLRNQPVGCVLWCVRKVTEIGLAHWNFIGMFLWV